MDKIERDKNNFLITNIKSYFKNQTYVNLVENTSNGVRYWNGFIISLDHDNMKGFTFFDIIDKITFPVLLQHIISLSVSTKKDPDFQTALMILRSQKW